MTVAAVPDDMLAAVPAGIAALPVPAPGAELVEPLRHTEFLVLDYPRRHDLLPVLGELPDLRVVQLLISGTDWVAGHIPPGVRLCRPDGARDNAVAEWVAAALLGIASGLLPAVRRGGWERTESDELRSGRVVLLGAGSVATATRDLLRRLGSEVTVVARRARAGVYPVTALPGLVADADAVVALLPATPETAHLVDACLLARMRDGAVLVNAGRGSVVDTAAVTAEVAAGRLRAVLDVTDPEPLPPDHPLWTLDGAYVSPHIAGATRQARRRAIAAAVRSLAGYAGTAG